MIRDTSCFMFLKIAGLQHARETDRDPKSPIRSRCEAKGILSDDTTEADNSCPSPE